MTSINSTYFIRELVWISKNLIILIYVFTVFNSCHYLPSYFRNEGETREPGFWTDTVNEGLAKAYKDSDQVNIVCKSRGMRQVIFLSYLSFSVNLSLFPILSVHLLTAAKLLFLPPVLTLGRHTGFSTPKR